MLSWLFKKRGNIDASAVPPTPGHAAKTPPTRRQVPAAAAQARPVEHDGVDWPAQLLAAQGDDAALLRVAQSATGLDIKMAAVSALRAESALRQAEREFRSHDRKVHRVAKQRLEAAVAQRETRAKAHTLLQRTKALMAEALVPVNHVVALDRDWEALPAHALEPGQCVEFAELRARLDALMRERGEALQRLQRWTADAKRFLLDWQRTVIAAAQHGTANDAAQLGRTVEALRQTRPEVPATTDLDLALAQALQSAALVQARLAMIEAPPADAADPARAQPEALQALDVTGGRADSQAVEGELLRVLNRRHEQWLLARQPPRAVVTVPPPAADKPQRSAPADARSAEQGLRLQTLVQQAEVALAEGQLGDVQRHLQAIEVALAKTNAALPDALRARHQALRIERGRLKGWQQWGDARARDDLTAAAQELARQTLAAADPGTPDGPKLNLKSHGESIRALRLRWKELDRQGAVASPDQWQRFDAALQTAHQPVAAQHAALTAARQENLVAREALLAVLEAQPVAEAPVQAADVAPDWKDRIRELDRFQNAWRKLGPIEHTVPVESREALQQRLHRAVARIEAPLQEARAAAAAEREQLIARAESLAQEAGAERPIPDAGRRVRDLQADWQENARRLPLPRGLENSLWTRFKAATDAVFALRDAAFAARDAELAANLATREALLVRLSALTADLPLADIERTLSEVDRAWRQGGELPRGAGDALEGRFRTARAVAAETLTAGVGRRWQAQCDTLAAKLALCEEREDAEVADLGQRWAELDSLPAVWEQALALRWARPVQAGPLPVADVNDLLLRLETALELPTAPEWQAARQSLKLRALKEAMEGRGPPKHGPTQQAEWLLATVRQGRLDTAQRERLRALVAALRKAPPGSILRG